MGTAIRITSLIIGMLSISTVFNGSYAFSSGVEQAPEVAPSPQYQRLQKALEQYYEIQRKGGWQPIKTTRKYYMQKQSADAVKQIKQRLRLTGDFVSDDSSVVFTEALAAAVKKVQKRFGFKQNGVVDPLLVKELNVPVEERIAQLQANLNRLQNIPVNTEGTRLVANIPEFKLYVYEGTQLVFDMDIVVGSQSHQTVIFDDEMTDIVFSPYWNVPPSIVAGEILPAMEDDPRYLRRNGYEQTGTENGLPVIRQKPGPKNSLGLVKFVFPNNHHIYFHDTPVKGLFRLPQRAFSHGCIRLAQPEKLAGYLLRNIPGWTAGKIKKAMNAGSEQWVKLPEPVQVSLTYFTAWVDEEGLLHLRKDVYGLDKKEADMIVKNEPAGKN